MSTTPHPLLSGVVRERLRGGLGPELLEVLTDEEVCVLEEDARTEPADRPFLVRHPEVARGVWRQVGVRSLLVRNLLVGPPDGAEQTALDLAPVLEAIVRARSEADVVVQARAATEDASRTLLLHGEGVCVEEDVVPVGLHAYAACDPHEAVRRLAHWALREDTPVHAAAPHRVPRASWLGWVRREVGTDARVVTLVVSRPEQPEPVTVQVASTADLAVVATVDPTEQDVLRVEQTGAEHLATLVGGLALDAV